MGESLLIDNACPLCAGPFCFTCGSNTSRHNTSNPFPPYPPQILNSSWGDSRPIVNRNRFGFRFSVRLRYASLRFPRDSFSRGAEKLQAKSSAFRCLCLNCAHSVPEPSTRVTGHVHTLEEETI